MGKDHFVTLAPHYKIERGALFPVSFSFFVISCTTFSPIHTSMPFPHPLAIIVVKGATTSFALAVLDWLADGMKNKSTLGVYNYQTMSYFRGKKSFG